MLPDNVLLCFPFLSFASWRLCVSPFILKLNKHAPVFYFSQVFIGKFLRSFQPENTNGSPTTDGHQLSQSSCFTQFHTTMRN